MPIAAQPVDYRPTIAMVHDDRKSITSPYAELLCNTNAEISRTYSWASKKKFAAAQQELARLASLKKGWDSYDAEAPNTWSMDSARHVLSLLEQESMHPSRVMPSREGGITISFAEGPIRGEIEIYNSGEMAAAAYSPTEVLRVWEVSADSAGITEAITNIRVYLTA